MPSPTHPNLRGIVGPDEGVSVVRTGYDLVGHRGPGDTGDYEVVLLQHVGQAPGREARAVTPLVDLQPVIVGAQRQH